MKASHRGFEITVTREKSCSGALMLFYGVFRKSDGWEMTSGFSDSSDTVREMIKMLKAAIDDYHQHPEDWKDK